MSNTRQSGLEPQVTLPWLVRLRWLAVLGQAVAVAVAYWIFELQFWWWLLCSLVLVAAASNMVLAARARSLPSGWSAALAMGWVMTFDTVLLTLLLATSGGPMNPFTVFYLVHITLSAVVLSARWTLFVGALSFAGFGALFLLPVDEHALHGSSGLAPHLQGMWVAFALAAGLTMFFLRQITQAIGVQREQIAALREAGARNARLAAITTLAAGAAHELGSPLGTIAIAAHDARLALLALPVADAVAEDLQLILLEVERCQEILGLMAARAAESSDDIRQLGVRELCERVSDHLVEEQRHRVEFRVDAGQPELQLPPGQTIQSLVALVRNALDASPSSQPIVVQVSQLGPEAHISVQDHGMGIPAPVLPRVGEPFFTTKQPGRGLGLGIFLVRAFVESRGGELVIQSSPGAGTLVRMRIPMGTVQL